MPRRRHRVGGSCCKSLCRSVYCASSVSLLYLLCQVERIINLYVLDQIAGVDESCRTVIAAPKDDDDSKTSTQFRATLWKRKTNGYALGAKNNVNIQEMKMLVDKAASIALPRRPKFTADEEPSSIPRHLLASQL